MTQSMWPGSDNHVAALQYGASQQALWKLQRSQSGGAGMGAPDAGLLRMSGRHFDVGQIGHTVDFIQSIQK